MLIKEAKIYRNTIINIENDIINGKINVGKVSEWTALFYELVDLKEKREDIVSKTAKEDLKELKHVLHEQDVFLNKLIMYIMKETHMRESKSIKMTDLDATKSFADIRTICLYNNITNKLTHMESLALKDPTKDKANMEKFYNSFGQLVYVPSAIANTYENLLLQQMDLVDSYNEIISALNLDIDNSLKEEIEQPINFDLIFYLSCDLISKKEYVDNIINRILNAESKLKIKVKCFGITYSIPRKYKALFLELQLKSRILNEQIEKNDLALIQSHKQINEEELTYEVKNINPDDFPKIDLSNLKDNKAVYLLVDILTTIKSISKKGKESSKKDVIVYKDKYSLYYVNKNDEVKFRDLYSKKLSLENRIYHLDGKIGFNHILAEIRSRLTILKNCLISTSLDDEINILADIFCEEYKKKMMAKEEELQTQLTGTLEDQSFYKQIILNMQDFLHSTKLNTKEKRKYLNNLDRMTNYTNPDIHEGLEFLDLSIAPVAHIDSVKPSKNIDKLLGSLNKAFPFIKASLLTPQDIERTNIEKDLDEIIDLASEIDEKKQGLLDFLDNEGIKR